jgi:general secretion pathway protein G
MNRKQGFTLVEVLIVISIIGLLASIILVGLGGFRAKGRDTRRITDLRSVQTALELYYTKFSEYPADSNWDALESTLRGAGIGVTNIPRDPLTGRAGLDQYAYDASSDRQSYVLRALLEDPNTPQLRDDFDGFGSNPIPGITLDCSDSTTKPYYCVQF